MPKDERVIDGRRDDVGSGDDGELICKLVNASVIARIETDEKV